MIKTPPRLTPRRALDLLRRVERAWQKAPDGFEASVLQDVSQALADHVASYLGRKRRAGR